MTGQSDRPTKISFSEMRDSGVRGILVYCAIVTIAISGTEVPALLSTLVGALGASGPVPGQCQPVWTLSYCGFDPLMGRPFALKSGRPCQPLEIALPTKNRSCS
jgi:hypothetical protein